MRRGQRPVTRGRRALRLHVRGCLPPAHDRQGRQPRHRLVRAAGRRLARGPRGLRGMAGSDQSRRRRQAAPAAARPGIGWRSMAVDPKPLEERLVIERETWADGPPHALFGELRSGCPVHWSAEIPEFPDESGYWSVTTAEDIHTV